MENTLNYFDRSKASQALKTELNWAGFQMAEYEQNLPEPKQFFYILEWFGYVDFYPGIHQIRIGITKDPNSRLAHHKSSYPRWNYNMVIQVDNASDIESFIGLYLKPFLDDQGGCSVFVVPDNHYAFIFRMLSLVVGAKSLPNLQFDPKSDQIAFFDHLRSLSNLEKFKWLDDQFFPSGKENIGLVETWQKQSL